ncbi:SAF domain-containing protein [Propioniciclava sinopodophylli]|uniref:SAF domain-containing protein n=1 Tax=Propioniciclava sinopodophylli TaxID=1837344 RepID=UPI002490A4EA|nr:SAF domain-containing protein [Propioniciclava sinopodophylli]
MESPVPDATRPRIRLRRSPLWLLAGILAVCLGGLASAFVYLSLTASDPVLRVNRTIHRGEVIQGADLSVVSVGTGVDVRTVGDERAAEVIGRAAVTDVPGGSLLVEGSWGESGVPVGSARVGLRLSAGRFPTTDLRPGTQVLVVALPAQGEAEAELPGSIPASLVGEPAVQTDGSTLLALSVPAGSAELVARLAAADRVALVQTGNGR